MCVDDLYETFKAYERQWAESASVLCLLKRSGPGQPAWHKRLLGRLGDFLIRTGLKLKKRYASKQSTAFSASSR